MELTAEEARVLGALIEKEATTPDQYPLSTNALVTACNQKTSRDPVVSYTDRTISETMLLLRPAGLARTIISGRTEKHRHVLDEVLGLSRTQLAVLAVLMLRGPQTPGELRTRTDRYVDFDSVDAVDAVLRSLAEHDETLVRDLGRAPGQSQDRWTHTLGGEVSAMAPTAPMAGDGAVAGRASRETVVEPGPTLTERVKKLEERIAALEEALGV